MKPETEHVTYLTIELPGDRLRRKIRANQQWKKERVDYLIAAVITAVIMWCLIAWGIL